MKIEYYRFWEFYKVSDELFIANLCGSSILEAYKTKSITGKSIDDIKIKIDKHIKRWGW